MIFPVNGRFRNNTLRTGVVIYGPGRVSGVRSGMQIVDPGLDSYADMLRKGIAQRSVRGDGSKDVRDCRYLEKSASFGTGIIESPG